MITVLFHFLFRTFLWIISIYSEKKNTGKISMAWGMNVVAGIQHGCMHEKSNRKKKLIENTKAKKVSCPRRPSLWQNKIWLHASRQDTMRLPCTVSANRMKVCVLCFVNFSTWLVFLCNDVLHSVQIGLRSLKCDACVFTGVYSVVDVLNISKGICKQAY